MLDAYIYDGLRSPIGRHAGKLAGVRPDDLAGEVIAGVVKRNKAPGSGRGAESSTAKLVPFAGPSSAGLVLQGRF